jgi:hypothetical protein
MHFAYATVAYASDRASRMAGVAYAMPTHKDCAFVPNGLTPQGKENVRRTKKRPLLIKERSLTIITKNSAASNCIRGHPKMDRALLNYR